MADLQCISTKEGPSEGQWLFHRPLITQLYHIESCSLREVMEIMERDFAFKASEKMYKSRIRQWQLDKKRKRPEMLFASRITKQRRRQGKSTRITIRGLDVSEAEVEKYFKRQKTSAAMDETACGNAKTPPEVEYGTPSPQQVAIAARPYSQSRPNTDLMTASILAPSVITWQFEKRSDFLSDSNTSHRSPKVDATTWPCQDSKPELRAVRGISIQNDVTLDAPHHLPSTETCMSKLAHLLGPVPTALYGLQVTSDIGFCEATLHCTELYLKTYYLNSSHWLRFAGNTLVTGMSHYGAMLPQQVDNPNGQPIDPDHIPSDIEVAIQLFVRGKAQEAWRLIHTVCENMKQLVYEQHPQLVSSILVTVSYLRTTTYQQIDQIILRHFHDVASVMLGDRHPLTMLASLLARAILEDRHVAGGALAVIRDVYSANTAYDHPERLRAMHIDAWAMLRRGEPAPALHAFRELQGIWEAGTSPDSVESRKILYSLALAEIASKNSGNAKALLEEHQRRTERKYGAFTPVESKIECLRVRASLCKLRGELEEMEMLLSKA